MATYDRAAEAAAAWFAAGADSVYLALPPGRAEDELAEIVKVAAEVVSAGASALPVGPKRRDRAARRGPASTLRHPDKEETQ